MEAALLVASGVNLDLLGTREPTIYGAETLKDMESLLIKHARGLGAQFGFQKVSLTFFQTNEEHQLLKEISKPYDGIVLNAGAWTHTSLALSDRLKGLGTPYVEVHVSNIHQRESFRHHSYCAPFAKGVTYGFGINSYLVGLVGLLLNLAQSKTPS